MENKTIGIYAIFRKSDDKCMYVGQSIDCERRIFDHMRGHTHTPIENKDDYYTDIIEKHGFDSSVFRLEREAFWINVFEPEWNEIKNRHLSDKHISAIKKTLHVYYEDDNNRKKIGLKNKGNNTWKKMTKEAQEKESERRKNAMLGENNPSKRDDVRTKLSKNNFMKNHVGVMCWVYKDNKNKRIYKSELEDHLINGWKRGLKQHK